MENFAGADLDKRVTQLGLLREGKPPSPQGKKIARVAAARKLLGVMFHLMKDEIDYEEFVRRSSSAQRAR